MVLKHFCGNAVVTEFISTRSGLPPALLGLSQNAGSALLGPGQASCCSWYLQTQPVSRTRSCCCCWDRSMRWSRKAKSFDKDGLVHFPSSHGGGCMSLEKCSRIRTLLCLKKANNEQTLVADGQNHCMQGMLVHTGVFQDISANEQRSTAYTCTSKFASPFAEAVFAGSGTLQGRQSCQTQALCKAEADLQLLGR